jgi:hypothetical protein
MLFAGWSPIGIAALITLVAGIALLVVYAVQRGFVHRELEGIEAGPDPGTESPARPSMPARRSRTLGLLGALLLVVGLGLGAAAAVGTWSAGGASGAGLPPDDCAQSWDGCPKSTIKP